MIDLLMHTDRRYAAAMARARRARHEALRATGRGLIRLPAKGVRALASRWRRRRLVAELRALNDLVLADIGLYRGDIWATVDEILRRERSGWPIGERHSGDRPLLPEPAWTRSERNARETASANNDNAAGDAGLPPSSARERNAS